MKTTLKIVCMWCGKDMGEKDGEGVEGTSHSICEACHDYRHSKIGKRKLKQNWQEFERQMELPKIGLK